MKYDSPVPPGYANASMAQQGAYTAPATPTRFLNCASQLDACLGHFAAMMERLSRVADRLGGSVPEEAQAPNKIRGNGGNVASQIESSLEDFDVLARRAERVVERLEAL